MTPFEPWTTKEDALIIENWPEKSVAELSKMLGRLNSHVATRVQDLRKRGYYLPHKLKRWTAEEDNLLITLRTTHTNKELAKILNRGIQAVKYRITRLKRWGKIQSEYIRDPLRIRRGTRWDPEQTQFVIDHANDTSIEDIAKELERTDLGIAYRIVMYSEDNGFLPDVVRKAELLIDDYKKQKGDDGE
jgi:biotin operon repressor